MMELVRSEMNLLLWELTFIRWL